MFRGRLSYIILFSMFSVLIGCSHGGDYGVTAPATNLKTSFESTSGHVLWGMWSCALDNATGTIEIVPLRGPMFTANVNNLLEGKPGNLLIKDLDLTQLFDNGLVKCTVTLRHPFPGLDMYNGFDVWGVFMHNGESTLAYDSLSYPGGLSAGENEAVLLNADGYTRWFNYTEFSGTGFPIVKFKPGKLGKLNDQSAMLNGYRIFADDLGMDEDYYGWISNEANYGNRGIFRAGQTNSRHYEMKFPLIGGVPKVDFQYAVVASWEPGDPSLTGDELQYDPFDFPSSANCDEALYVHSNTFPSTLYNDGAGSSGGSFRSDIEIFDWQGGIVSSLGVPNEIKRVIIEGNFVPGGSYEWDQSTLSALAVPGTGVSSVFQVDIGGCSPDPVESEEYWLIVESGGTAGASYNQGFPSPYPLDAVRAAFYRGSVVVSDQSPIGVTVTSIDPDSAPFWGNVDDAEVSGTNFENGCTVELRKDADVVTATDVVWLDSESLTCDFDLTGADSGLWDVAVINPGLEEGVLEDGFTIEVWSEEQTLEVGGDRLPQLAETSVGSAVLLVGCDDNNMRYIPFEEGVRWGSVDIAVSGNGGHWLLVMTSDPVNDDVYLASNLENYRYTGNPGPWEYQASGWSWARAGAVATDINGKFHLFQNTSDAFGHINHSRRSAWMGTMEIYLDNVMDGWNINIFGDGNLITQNSSGTIFMTYERDWWLNQYGLQQQGPRWVKVFWVPLGDLAHYHYADIDVAYDMDPLDSPSITCDTDNVLHVDYRKWIPSTSKWQVIYKRSNDSGPTWVSPSIIYEGDTEPEYGHVLIGSDSDNAIHTVYNIDGEFDYRNSADGATWSSVENVNPSGSSLPPGTDDFAPKTLVTSDGIMHVAWIRGDKSSGYGDLRWRMRDLL